MKIPRIKMLGLSLTGQCNFACRYCYAVEHAEEKMSDETALQAVQMAVAAGESFILQFTGGEPLLNFSCLKTVADYVKEQNIPALMQIQTNASLINDEIAVFLKQRHIGIGISLDGKPSMNDSLRRTKVGRGATSLILRGVEKLREHHIACGLTCVVTSENVATLEDIVEMAYFLGNVRKIGFDLLRGQGRGKLLCPPQPEAMASAMEKVIAKNEELAEIFGYKLLITQQQRINNLACKGSKGFGHCYAMNGEAAFVDAQGKIYACSSLVGKNQFYLGNVLQGIDKKLVAEVRNYIADAMENCRKCPAFHLCGGGCYARWYGSDNKTAYESECAMQKILILNNKKDKY